MRISDWSSDVCSSDLLVGDTDSERYFRCVRQSIEEHGDEAEGVSQALATLIKKFPESSLNALMLTPESMFAIHINSRALSPLRALRAMFDDEDEIPARHMRSEEHTSELQSLMRISYDVFCLKKKQKKDKYIYPTYTCHSNRYN